VTDRTRVKRLTVGGFHTQELIDKLREIDGRFDKIESRIEELAKVQDMLATEQTSQRGRIASNNKMINDLL